MTDSERTPRTTAGREHLDYIRRWSEDEGATWTDFDTEEMGGRILAIEAEAWKQGLEATQMERAEAAALPERAGLDVHPRTYSLVGGPHRFIVTDDESGFGIGYADEIGGPLVAPRLAALTAPTTSEGK